LHLARYSEGTKLAVQAEQDEPAHGPSAAERLRQISELHAAGLLTDEEFAAKRAEPGASK